MVFHTDDGWDGRNLAVDSVRDTRRRTRSNTVLPTYPEAWRIDRWFFQQQLDSAHAFAKGWGYIALSDWQQAICRIDKRVKKDLETFRDTSTLSTPSDLSALKSSRFFDPYLENRDTEPHSPTRPPRSPTGPLP